VPPIGAPPVAIAPALPPVNAPPAVEPPLDVAPPVPAVGVPVPALAPADIAPLAPEPPVGASSWLAQCASKRTLASPVDTRIETGNVMGLLTDGAEARRLVNRTAARHDSVCRRFEKKPRDYQHSPGGLPFHALRVVVSRVLHAPT
jgi:hypothetical protein